MKARVTITLKAGVLDPQGKAIEGALQSLGVAGITSVRQGKLFDIEVEGDAAKAEATLQMACEKLLANTVIENYRIRLGGAAADAAPPRGGAVDADKATEAAARDAEMPKEGHP
jgi:phosphoribosylformylglycinamidine synthase